MDSRVILVVDDDPMVRRTLREILADIGYAVITADDGMHALTLFREHRPRFVLADLLMPGKDGIELMRDIRRERADVKVIVMSGGARGGGLDYVALAMKLGADAGIHKPFDGEELHDLLIEVEHTARKHPRRRHRAVHAAGHFALARALGVPHGPASINPDKAAHAPVGDPGEILAAWHAERGKTHRTLRAACLAELLVFMAGREAEEECLGCCSMSDRDDLSRCDAMLDLMLPPGAERARVAQRIRRASRRLVRRHRLEIEHLAGLLQRHESLTVAQIHRASHATARDRPFPVAMRRFPAFDHRRSSIKRGRVPF